MRVEIGKTYFYDVLGESNMSVTTSAVTVVKKAQERNKWTVMSVNTQEVFECDKEMLTPIVDYETIQPIIRCQYGVTDFSDSEIFAIKALVPKMLRSLNDMASDANVEDPASGVGNTLMILTEEFSKAMGKVIQFYKMSQYKKIYSCIGSFNKAKEKTMEALRGLQLADVEKEATIGTSRKSDDRPLKTVKFETAENNRIKESEFGQRLDRLMYYYVNIDIAKEQGLYLSEDEFVEKVKKTILDYFPSEEQMEDRENCHIYREEIEAIKRDAKARLVNNNIIFFIGTDMEGNRYCFDVRPPRPDQFEDEDEFRHMFYETLSLMDEHIDELAGEIYEGYDDKRIRKFESKYHISTISFPRRAFEIGEDDEEDDEE